MTIKIMMHAILLNDREKVVALEENKLLRKEIEKLKRKKRKK